jgi:acetylornithine deacetylase/succinyl-diaminopimelate desuccinylase-like protein
MVFLATQSVSPPVRGQGFAVSPSTTPAIDIGYANYLIAALKHLSWSEGIEDGPIRGMHAYGYTKAEQDAINLYVQEATKLGMTPFTDLAGNVYLLREGNSETRVSRKAIMVTSHLDTVEGGGAHDGRDGLVAALASVKALKDSNTTLPHDLVIMVCRSEESDINGVFSLGARLACGDVTWSELEGCTNRKSRRPVTQHMAEIGLDINALQAKLSNSNQEDRALIPIRERAASLVDALVELHIEQGRYVSGDPSRPDVGLVQHIRGNARAGDCSILPKSVESQRPVESSPKVPPVSRGRSYTISVPIKGEAAHSGATQPRDRADAVSTALSIGASMLSRFGCTSRINHPSLQIVELNTSNTSPTTIAGDATITFRVDNATEGEIRKIVRSLKTLCRKLSGDSRNKQLRIGDGGKVSSGIQVEERSESSQMHAEVETYVALMNKVRQWFVACYQTQEKDIVFTPAVVNLKDSSTGQPTLCFHFEIRSIEPNVLENFRSFVTGLVTTLNGSSASRASIIVPEVRISQPVTSDPGVVEALSKTAKQIGVSFNLVNSGAGHDTSTLTRCGYPGAMVFIRQPNPISHNPDEERDEFSFLKATELLTAFLNQSNTGSESSNFIAELIRLGAPTIAHE